MAFCNDPTNPANVSPEERLEEIAAILAAGVMRLRRGGTVPAIADSAGNDLEVPPEMRLHEHHG